jgi:hypothetical protein
MIISRWAFVIATAMMKGASDQRTDEMKARDVQVQMTGGNLCDRLIETCFCTTYVVPTSNTLARSLVSQDKDCLTSRQCPRGQCRMQSCMTFWSLHSMASKNHCIRGFEALCGKLVTSVVWTTDSLAYPNQAGRSGDTLIRIAILMHDKVQDERQRARRVIRALSRSIYLSKWDIPDSSKPSGVTEVCEGGMRASVMADTRFEALVEPCPCFRRLSKAVWI